MIKKKIGLIIQARMSSTRLPAKMMKLILGKPMIFRILERVKLCKTIDDVIVSIPKNKSDDKLFNYLVKQKTKVFRGSEKNLLNRYYYTAKKYDLDFIVRLPGDNPLPDYIEIDRLVRHHMKIKNNINIFSSNLQPIKKSNYIDGIGAEIFSMRMLEKLFKNKRIQKSTEHVSLNFYDFEKQRSNNSSYFKISYPKSPKSIAFPNIVLDVNYLKQFKFIKRIYENLYPKKKFFLTYDIIKYLKKNDKELFKNIKT